MGRNWLLAVLVRRLDDANPLALGAADMLGEHGLGSSTLNGKGHALFASAGVAEPSPPFLGLRFDFLPSPWITNNDRLAIQTCHSYSPGVKSPDKSGSHTEQCEWERWQAIAAQTRQNSHSFRRGQPASIQARSSATRQRVERPILTGCGIHPAASQVLQVRSDVPHM